MKELDLYYLNLGTAVARREAFLAKYEACHFTPHWHLQRFHAIDAQHDLVKTAQGSLGPGNKGCYFSSLVCITGALASDRHLFIVDDDIEFCRASQFGVDRAIEQTDEADWDVILTDTIIPNAYDMPRMLIARHEYDRGGHVTLIDLGDAPFTFCAGSTIINRRSKQKILDLMKTDDFSAPWDMVMRRHIKKGLLRAFLIFPYMTTVSALADDSQIAPDQDKLEHRLYSEFRRMMWVGYQPKPYYSEFARKEYRDVIRDEVLRMNAIMTPLLSLQLKWVEGKKAEGA